MVKKPRQKQLKLKDIQKKFNDVNKLSTHVLDEEENLVIKYNKKFDNKEIESLMKEAYENLKIDLTSEKKFLVNDETFIQYVLFLIIKYFTELRNEIPSSLHEQIPIFNQLISTGLFQELLENCLDAAEISKVLERFAKYSSLVAQNVELENKEKNKIAQQVQHPLIKQKFNNASDIDA